MRSLKDLFDLEGRVALISGGAGHIGRASAEALLELGARVALLDSSESACSEASGSLEPLGSVTTYVADVARESDVRRVVADLMSRESRLDVVIHAAAFVGTTTVAGWAEPFEKQSAAAFDAAMRVNVTAAFILAQSAAAALKTSGGSIVLFSSIYGLVGPDLRLYEGTAMQNPIGYGASKGALLQLSRSLATTMAPVRVNAISPGGLFRGQDPHFVDRYEARTPLGRMATEEDVKGAVAYLSSGASAYVTGQNLVLDGGWTAW